MDDYKFVNKYVKKEKKGFIKRLNKFLLLIVIFLVALIAIKYDKNGKGVIYNFLNEKNINFAFFNNWYKEHLSDILPFDNNFSNSQEVFNEEIEYDALNKYMDGVSLNVGENYLVPIIESGVVVFSGEKDNYGNTVIIQQADGILLWYGNLSNVNVNIYDYVNKGEFLGEANNELYLVYQGENGFLDYKQYLK